MEHASNYENEIEVSECDRSSIFYLNYLFFIR